MVSSVFNQYSGIIMIPLSRESATHANPRCVCLFLADGSTVRLGLRLAYASRYWNIVLRDIIIYYSTALLMQ